MSANTTQTHSFVLEVPSASLQTQTDTVKSEAGAPSTQSMKMKGLITELANRLKSTQCRRFRASETTRRKHRIASFDEPFVKDDRKHFQMGEKRQGGELCQGLSPASLAFFDSSKQERRGGGPCLFLPGESGTWIKGEEALSANFFCVCLCVFVFEHKIDW